MSDIKIDNSILRKHSIKYILPNNYPNSLKEFENQMPKIIYYKGNLDLLYDKKIIGIVGTRNIDYYGKEITSEYSSYLVKKGWTIVSGGAIGVDSFAHSNSIERTICVLASGLDNMLPNSNQILFDKILNNNGLIISEQPPKTNMQKYYYLERNRIIALLGQKIFIPQAPNRSGAINTAAWATKFNKDIFCPPSNINSPLSYGTNKLLFSKQAELTLDPQDIIDFDNFEEPSLSFKLSHLKDAELQIYKYIKKNKDVSMNSLQEHTSIPYTQLSNILFDLENSSLITKTLLGYNII